MNRVYRLILVIVIICLALPFADSAFATGIEVGDTVIFGHTLQESLHGGSVLGGAPIEWQVLAKEDNKLLLITKQAIDYKPYGGSTWEDSFIRSYLNDSFYNTVFSEEEKSVIVPTTISADPNSLFVTDQGSVSIDQVFLLSINEVKEYFPTVESRCCSATAYVNGEGTFQGLNGNCNWILRTMGFRSSYVSSVFSYGALDYFGHNINDENLAIRPAIWINIGSDAWKNLENSNYSQDENATKRIQSMDLKFAEEIIHAGRRDENSTKTNNVQDIGEDADIRKQIQLIYDSMENWKRDSSIHTVMYSVTDFDHNGRLEIVTAENYSSGHYTIFNIWEISDDRNALIDLGSGIESNFMLSYGNFENDSIRNDVCAPDVISDRYAHSLYGEPITEVNAYSLQGDSRVYYAFQNFSGGVENWEQIQEVLFLENEGLHVFPIAWRYKEDFWISSRYYDYNGHVIGPQQYADLDSFFEGYQKKVVRLYWLWDSTTSVETLLDSYRVFLQE